MMAADSLHVTAHLVVPSGVLFYRLPPCRRACSASADPAYPVLHFGLPSAQPSYVQASWLENGWPTAIAVFAGVLAAGAAAQPGRRFRTRESGVPGVANAEGKTKGGGTCRPEKPVCTWGWRGTRRLRRRAAWGARPAPMRAFPRASNDRTRHSLQGAHP